MRVERVELESLNAMAQDDVVAVIGKGRALVDVSHLAVGGGPHGVGRLAAPVAGVSGLPGVFLRILAEYPKDVRQVLERVPASSIKKYDLIVMDGCPLDESCEVLAIESLNGTYKIALKGFGVLKKVKQDKEFNRIQGSW